MAELRALMPVSALPLAALYLAELVLGFALMRVRSRAGAWALVVGSVAAANWLVRDETPVVRMVALVVALLYAMKPLVAVEEGTTLSLTRWLFFAPAWFGMRPSVFAAPRKPRNAELAHGAMLNLAAGAAFVFVATRLPKPWTFVPLVIGLSLVLHFGLFRLEVALLRRIGFDARPLFVAPLRAKTLAEFWSRSWNIGFSEMTALAVYRPLKRHHAALATMAAFLFSGVLHEIAISLPVRAGFGLPTLYFAIQGAAVIAERRFRPSNLRTLALLVLPLPLLAHPWFVRGMLASFVAS
jgi:hypothetical protein